MKRMAVLLLALVASVGCTATARPRVPVGAPSADRLVEFTDPESMTRLSRSDYKIDFFHLAVQFESQTNKAFCGPTSATIVLNALRAANDRIEKPQDASLVPAGVRQRLGGAFDPLYHRYTQYDVFNAEAAAVKTPAEVLGAPRTPGAKPDPGLQLRQLQALLAANGVASTLRIVDDALADETIRAELKTNLASADDYVIVNYTRAALGQEGGGHISPLGAYDEASDSFLILDVNPNGHTWVWAPAAMLIHAMRTTDGTENRGYLLVKEGTP